MFARWIGTLIGAVCVASTFSCGEGGFAPPPARVGTDGRRLATGDVRLAIDRRGIFGLDPEAGPGFGFFPARSRNSYLFGSGLWVGGLVDGVESVFTVYDQFGSPSFESVPGRVATRGGGADRILCSGDSDDLSGWYPEFSDPATGRPVVIGDEDCVVIYHDGATAPDAPEIGLEVRQRVVGFRSGLLSQAFVAIWDVANTGAVPLEQAFAAVRADYDIGTAAFDDRCSVVQVVPPGPNNPAGTARQANLGFCRDQDFHEDSFDPNPPGFAGATLLRGPDGTSPALTRFTLTGNPSFVREQPDPAIDSERYALLAGVGTRVPFVDGIATDQRFVAVAGPFQLEAGQVKRLVAAYVWANASARVDSLHTEPRPCFGRPVCSLPDPSDPALHELLEVQRAAQEFVDLHVPLQPGPP